MHNAMGMPRCLLVAVLACGVALGAPLPDSAPRSFTLRVSGTSLEGEALDGNQRYMLRAVRFVE